MADPSTWLGWTDGAPGGISAAPLLLSHCRHALPLFTSLLNTVCAYDPVGYGIPYNHLLFSDYREPLVEEAVQVLIVTLDHDSATSTNPTVDGTTTGTAMDDADVRTGGGEQGSCRPLGGWHSLQQSWARGLQWALSGEPGATEVKEALLPAPRPGVEAEGRGTCLPPLHPWQPPGPENLFVNYLSRIHREEVSRALLLFWWILAAHPTVIMALQGVRGGR